MPFYRPAFDRQFSIACDLDAMTNKEIGKILKNTSDMIELTGGNPFRARSMANAARTLERWEEPLDRLAEEGRLTSIRGVGDGLAAQITELLHTGTFEAREELLGAIPAGVLDMMRVKGLGAKKVRALWQNMGIDSLDELEHAASANLIASQEGFGAKTQENILKNIQLIRQYLTRRRYADVATFVTRLLEEVRNAEGIDRVEATADVRRKLETIGQVAFVVQASSFDAIHRAFAPWLDPAAGGLSEVEGRLEGRLANGLPGIVHPAGRDEFGTMLWRTTGSDSHVGAFESQFGAPASHSDEAALFAAAGTSPIPPELREGRDEIEQAMAGALPDLVSIDDIRGTLHNHSTYSDGTHTLEQMAQAARAMGMAYFGICDHSRSLVVASGLSIEEVARQQAEIQALNRQFEAEGGAPFKVFSGIESDILADGSLDYPDEVLASFDLVVASVHTRMNMNVEEATERIVKAVRNPYTTILGHPTGRILLVREGYPIDYDRVLDACAEQNVAVELNANPYRLDLDWRRVRAATERGILISINPDAHSTDGLKDMYWGVEAARKGGLEPDMCLNAKTLEAFEAWLAQRKAPTAF